MPTWHQNMTAEDFARNRREWERDESQHARRLREQAKAMLAEAERIEKMLRGEFD